MFDVVIEIAVIKTKLKLKLSLKSIYSFSLVRRTFNSEKKIKMLNNLGKHLSFGSSNIHVRIFYGIKPS